MSKYLLATERNQTVHWALLFHFCLKLKHEIISWSFIILIILINLHCVQQNKHSTEHLTLPKAQSGMSVESAFVWCVPCERWPHERVLTLCVCLKLQLPWGFANSSPLDLILYTAEHKSHRGTWGELGIVVGIYSSQSIWSTFWVIIVLHVSLFHCILSYRISMYPWHFKTWSGHEACSKRMNDKLSSKF